MKYKRVLLSKISLINPKCSFENEELADLAQHISETGGNVLPVILTPNDTGFRLLAGSLEYWASQEAGLASVNAFIISNKESNAVAHQLSSCLCQYRQFVNTQTGHQGG